MQYIQLVRGSGYGPIFDLTFAHGDIFEVTDEQATYLLSLGRFHEVAAADIPAAEPGSESIEGVPQAAPGTKIHTPQNLLSKDNLNGKRILMRRNGAIGDCLFVIQIAAYLKKKYPLSHITLAVTPTVCDFCRQFTCLDEVITLETSCTHSCVTSMDYVIPFSGVLESDLVHDTNYYQKHFEHTGMQWDDSFEIPALKRDTHSKVVVAGEAQAKKIMSSSDLIHNGYVVILPTTSSPLRTVNATTLAKVAHNIAHGIGTRYYSKVVYVTPTDETFTPPVEASKIYHAKTDNLCCATALIAHAAVVIGGDTGLTHTAGALGVPTVSLWTCTDPSNILTSIEHAERTTAIQADCDCSPCRQIKAAYCKAFTGNASLCSERVPVDKVCAAVDTHLAAVALRKTTHTMESVAQTSPVVLSVEDATPLIDGSFVDVAFPIAMLDMYTGGGFYCWYLARSIAAHNNMRVWVLSDSPQPVFFNGASQVPDRFNVVYDPEYTLLSGKTKAKFAFIFGQPQAEGLAAVRYAKETPGARSFCILYETPIYIRKYKAGKDSTDIFWEEYRRALEDCDCCITVSQVVKESILEWVPSFAERPQFLQTVTPIVDDAMCDAILPQMGISNPERVKKSTRTNSIVLCSRNVDYKQMESAVSLLVNKFAPLRSSLEQPFTIHIIGAKSSAIARKFHSHELTARAISVIAHENCPEDKKWELLGASRALLHPSEFESFGIPVAEGMLACTPVVAHPLPVFKQAFSNHPYYYTDEKSLLSTLHHIWDAWDSEAGKYSSLTKMQKFLYEAFNYARSRFRAYIRDVRLNTIFERNWDDTRKLASTRAVEKSDGDTLRVAIITPWNTASVASTLSKIIATEVQCSFRIFAPEVSHGVREPDAVNVTRCYPKEFRYSNVLAEVSKYSPDIVHLVLDTIPRKVGQQHTLKFINALKESGKPVVVSFVAFNKEGNFFQDVSAAADYIVSHRHLALAQPVKQRCVPPPCVVYTSPGLIDAKAALGIDEYTYVVGFAGGHVTEKDATAFIESRKEVVANTPIKVMYMICATNDIGADIFAAQDKTFKTFPSYVGGQILSDRLAACDVVVCCESSPANITTTSGAARSALAAKKPLILAGESIFDDLPTTVCKRVVGADLAAGIATAILDFRTDSASVTAYISAASTYCVKHTVAEFAANLSTVYQKAFAEVTRRGIS